MKTPTRGLGRPLRCLILVATAGAVLAADNSWLTKLRFDFDDPVGWISNFYSTKMPSPEPAAVPMEHVTTATLSMDRLVNGRLFSQPASGWQLDSARFNVAPIFTTQKASGPIVEVNGATSPASSFSSVSAAHSAGLPSVPNTPTASGSWISNATGIWSSTTNWQGGVIADGAGNTAHFDTLNINTPVTVLLDTSRTIGNLYIGDTDGTDRYTIAPTSSSLTFDTGTSNPSIHSILQQTSTSAGDTINVSILMNSDLDINNVSGANQFTVSGNISPNGGASDFRTLWFNNVNTMANTAGNILVSGNITDGANGASLSVVMLAGGTVTFTGTNTYTGFTEIDGGTLLIHGTNSGPGTVYVYDTGTLGGHGTIAGNVYTFGGRITGDTATTVGTLTLQGNVNLATGEGAGGTYLANLSGSTSDLLAITGQLVLGLGTTLDIDGTANGTTTYILATFASHSGVFENVMDIPGGYSLVYNPTDIELVPIPEPATWIGGALALCAVAYAQRRRLRRA